MIRTLIIDNEPDVLEVLQDQLTQNCPKIEIVGKAVSVADAREKIRKLNPQLLLLDIYMADGTGFDLLKHFPNASFKVIFVSAFPDRALNVIKANALDFVTKPIDRYDLIEAIKKAEEKVQQEMDFDAIINEKTLLLPHAGRYVKVSVLNIMYLEADGSSTYFYLNNEPTKICASHNIKNYENFLAENEAFFRVHNSYIVCKKCVLEFEHKGDGGVLFLQNGKELPVAKNRKKDTLTWLSS